MTLEIILLVTLWKGTKLEEQTTRKGFETMQECEEFKRDITSLETALAPGHTLKLECTYGEIRE